MLWGSSWVAEHVSQAQSEQGRRRQEQGAVPEPGKLCFALARSAPLATAAAELLGQAAAQLCALGPGAARRACASCFRMERQDWPELPHLPSSHLCILHKGNREGVGAPSTAVVHGQLKTPAGRNVGIENILHHAQARNLMLLFASLPACKTQHLACPHPPVWFAGHENIIYNLQRLPKVYPYMSVTTSESHSGTHSFLFGKVYIWPP